MRLKVYQIPKQRTGFYNSEKLPRWELFGFHREVYSRKYYTRNVCLQCIAGSRHTAAKVEQGSAFAGRLFFFSQSPHCVTGLAPF